MSCASTSRKALLSQLRCSCRLLPSVAGEAHLPCDSVTPVAASAVLDTKKSPATTNCWTLKSIPKELLHFVFFFHIYLLAMSVIEDVLEIGEFLVRNDLNTPTIFHLPLSF